MKIVILGGSFDPPHKGHEALLRAAAERIRPDRVLLVPAFQAPLKDAPRASAQARTAMVRAFVRGLPKRLRRTCGIELCEVRSRRKFYTVETLRRLRRAHPAAELHFVAGSDSAAAFDRWRQPAALKKLASWWAGIRPGSPSRLPGHFQRLPGRFPGISSTQVRRLTATAGPWQKLVPRRVADAIKIRGLYGKALLRKLKGMLKKGRFEHTLAVADLSLKLAVRHGADPDKAVLAALLHDCARCMPAERMIGLARAWRVAAPGRGEIIRHRPKLLHPYLGAELARRSFAVNDGAVLSAIRKHTLGDRRMTTLDRIVYVADAASDDRAHPLSRALRRTAFGDLDAALRSCLRAKLAHARSKESWIHPLPLLLWKNPPR